MNPALIAYETQLQYNLVYADVYIRAANDFNTSTGVRTAPTATRIAGVPSVDIPVQKVFKAGPGGVPKQIYTREITFPLIYLGTNKVKLNDFVGLWYPIAPTVKVRYEVKSILLTANTLITLGLLEQAEQAPGLTYVLTITDTLTYSDTMGAIVE